MDSLFDATEFDVAPKPASSTRSAVAGQLDIFGNVVEQPTAAPPGDGSDHDSSDLAGEAGDGETALPVDELEAAELDGSRAGNRPDEDLDPTDELNDPTWEPPVEVPVEHDSVARVSRSSPDHDPAEPVERRPSVDLLWARVATQPAAVHLLRNAAADPVHAYLLVGPPGSGRREAARAFAAAALCPRGGCGTCDVCRRSVGGSHPDLVEVEREGASINVEQAREIIRLALRSPVEGHRKVLVLVDFHLVTTAAPTLLKIIEEPPPSTVFLVLADQITDDLVTIASRCVEVRFQPLSASAVIAALVAEGSTREQAAKVAKAAGGRLDRARLLLADERLGERIEFWERLPMRIDGTGAAACALAAEAMTRLDEAAVAPLQARHVDELAALDARLEASGARGGVGQRKELAERHRREMKRLRDDEVRLGLSILERHYRDRLVAGPGAAPLDALSRIRTLNEDLVRNPGLSLALTALFLGLPVST